jgi:hypothetical protein
MKESESELFCTKPTALHQTHSPAPNPQPCTKPTALHQTHSPAPNQQPCTKPTALHQTHSPAPNPQPCTKPTALHQTTQQHISGDDDLHSHGRKCLISNINNFIPTLKIQTSLLTRPKVTDALYTGCFRNT